MFSLGKYDFGFNNFCKLTHALFTSIFLLFPRWWQFRLLVFCLFQKFIGHLISKTKQSLLKYDDESVKKYISKCVSFFWKACIQTPPLKFDFNVPPGTPFDSAVHRKCTVNGPNVAYTVWPVVYLHENGPVLVKGVVQCDGKLTDSKKAGTKPSNTKLWWTWLVISQFWNPMQWTICFKQSNQNLESK